MQRLVLCLTGTTPLMMHNERLSNPLDEYVKAIKAITGKTKKTDDDYNEMARLEWFGGIYADSGGPYVPFSWLRGCLIETGRTRRLGTSFERAILGEVQKSPLQYEGSRDLKALWADPRFQDRRAIGVKNNRVMRCRPIFHEWEVSFPLMLVTETLDRDAFEQIAHLAGVIQGIGDGRSIGFGRFTVKIQEVS